MQANEVCSLSQWQSCLQSLSTPTPKGSQPPWSREFCGRYGLQNLLFIVHFSEEIGQLYMKLVHIQRCNCHFLLLLPRMHFHLQLFLTDTNSHKTREHREQSLSKNYSTSTCCSETSGKGFHVFN